jgi:tetratricopeptide (TPR) repeat protein
MTRAARGLVLAGLLCLGGAARAQDDDDAGDAAAEDPHAGAERHLALGKAASDAGEFAAALEEFRAAYTLVPAPRVLYNMAQVERALGQADVALEHYQRFLVEIGSEPPETDLPPRIQIARAAVAVLAGEVGAVDVVADPGVEVLVDGRLRGLAPLGEPIRVMPGAHELLFRGGGRELRRALQVQAGQRLRADGRGAPPPPVVLALAPRPAPAAVAGTTMTRPPPLAPVASRPFYRRWYFWSALGVVAAAAGIAIYLSSRPPDCPTSVTCVNAR